MAPGSMMEWTYACKGFTLLHERDPELDEDMADCKWKKCGDVTVQAASSCWVIGAQVSLAAGMYCTRKYSLSQVSACGRYKVFTHKDKETIDLVVRVVKEYRIKIELLKHDETTYLVSFMNDGGDFAGATLEMGHNIGYARCLAREKFKVAEHVPLIFVGLSESGRCNVWKALKARKTSVVQHVHVHKPVIKRPSTKQAVLKFSKTKQA